jgi:Ser/Thr protein kinase RdoA (MazF antagonist)
LVLLEDLVAALRGVVASGDVPDRVLYLDGARCDVVAAGSHSVWRVEDGDERRCVKLYRSTADDPDRREYQALCLIAGQCRDRAPTPIAHFPAPVLPAVVTEWTPGVGLNDRPLTPDEITALTDCLATIHDLDTADVPAITGPPQGAVSRVRTMLADLSTDDPIVERALDEAAAWIGSADAELVAQLPCSAWGRGDPNLENVLVDASGHALVVDLENAGVTNVTFEVADMIEHLRSHCVASQDWAPLIDRLVAEKDRPAFAACRRLASMFWLAMLIGNPRAREINGTARQTVQAERVLTILSG